jgi:glutamate 5-kinase
VQSVVSASPDSRPRRLDHGQAITPVGQGRLARAEVAIFHHFRVKQTL